MPKTVGTKQLKRADELYSSSRRGNHSRHFDALVAMRRDGNSHPLGEGRSGARHQSTERVEVRGAYDPVHHSHGCLTHFADSALGGILSLARFFILGSLLLFLGRQLFHGWLWRYSSSPILARARTDRERHRCAHVRHLGECPIRYPAPIGGHSRSVLGGWNNAV